MISRIDSAAAFGDVAVIMGGDSAEREVSLNSGRAVTAGLQRSGIAVRAIDLQGDPIECLSTLQVDRVFIALHGRGGEDGRLQALLEMGGTPYTGSGVMASALAMDKLRSKLIWRGAGLATPDFISLREGFDPSAVVQELGLPLVVKPVHEGSSIGISKVAQLEELEPAWRQAVHYDSEVIAERWVEGEEYTVAILDGEPLPAIALKTPNLFYDYEAKYQADTTRYLCPCGLPRERERELQQLALSAFASVAASGWGRVDVLADGDGRFWLIEINTVPGMTDHSLVPMAAAAQGIDFDELVWRILEGSCG